MADRMLRPDELPFEVPDALAETINWFIDGFEAGKDLSDFDYAISVDQVIADFRMVDEEKDKWLYWYYIQGGWKQYSGDQKWEEYC